MNRSAQSDAVDVIDLYVGLTGHSGVQILLFLCTALLGGWLAFHFLLLPALEWFFRYTVEADITHHTSLWDLYTHWEVIIEREGGGETHYFFNPLLSFLPFIGLLGLATAIIVTTLLPPRLGFMRQKIRREVINLIDRLVRATGTLQTANAHIDLEKQLLQMDIRALHSFAARHTVPFDMLEELQKALRWEHYPFWKKVFRVNDVIRLYMRSYFTIEYGNQMLGLVYIGAALLIILIGLRGLKFIPPTKPSVIIFALFLEFVLLLLYATTVIYTRGEEESWQRVQEQPTATAGGADAEEIAKLRQEAQQLLNAFVFQPQKRNDE